MSDRLRIVFAGGGTAGHLFPGLAVAAELAALPEPPQVFFAGSGKVMEKQLVNEASFEYFSMRCSPLDGGMRGIWRFVSENIAGYREARRFLHERKANVVVGLGGYASMPCSQAAIASGVPLVVLEQNAIPGKATRWLAPYADLMCVAFEETKNQLQRLGPVRVTGNPIRAGFRRPIRSVVMRGSKQRQWRNRLLVLGGSGGARSLNENVPKALYDFGDQLQGWQIVHQTGMEGLAATRELYRKLAIATIVVPFVQNMPSVMRRTSVAVCRAGGSTLAELAATGVPAVLVPYPHATDDHQRRNAEVFVAAGAARMIDERNEVVSLGESLNVAIGDLISGTSVRGAMSAALLKMARPDAAWQVATMVYDLARQAVAGKAA